MRRPTPAARAEARLVHTPTLIALRVMSALDAGQKLPRGGIVALERFFEHLVAVRRPVALVRTEDFDAVSPSRTALYTLLRMLERFAPNVPLAPAGPLRRRWDRWLNGRYNAKPKKTRTPGKLGVPLALWPTDWQDAMAFIRRQTGVDLAGTDLKSKKPLSPRSIEDTELAVSLYLLAFPWAEAKGLQITPGFSAEAAEVFARYCRNERQVKLRSTVMYLERVRRFARRGLLMSNADLEGLSRVLHAWEELAGEEQRAKLETLEAFYGKYSLADIPRRAAALMRKAAGLPAHRAAAARLRRKGALFALTSNAPERLGDVSGLRFGPGGLHRHASGAWSLKVVQGKTRRGKSNSALWPEVGAILDAYILDGRDPARIAEVYDGLQGAVFMSLSTKPAHLEMPSVLYREEFGISEHMIRTLAVDFLKWHGEEGTAQVCQALLGHRDPEMHEAYRTDFRDQAALRRFEDTMDALRGSMRAGKAA